MIHQGALRYGGFRYLYIALALIIAAVLLYMTQARQLARGDTWQGYTLGTISALLVMWLASIGIRKRRYRSRWGSVQGWTSAHIYLGIAVVAIATLHCAWQFHANIHTYAYLLMLGVVLSGIVGIAFYSNLPRQQSASRGAVSRADLFAELFELDRQIRHLTKSCDPVTAAAVNSSIERTVVGGGVLVQLLGIDRSRFEDATATASSDAGVFKNNSDQRASLACVAERVPRAYRESEAASLQKLVVVLARRQTVLRRIRRDVQLQAWLRIWLFFHIPMTVATIGAVFTHVLTTFLYF